MGCCDFRSLHFTYLLDGCLYDDDLPIANLEPGVSGRNSLPLSDTVELNLGRASRFLMPFNFCIEFYNDFKFDFGPYISPLNINDLETQITPSEPQ